MSWERYERAAEKGPMSIFLNVMVLLIIFSIFMGGVGYTFGWFGEAAQVAQKEFGPQAALEKYEWFIDQSNRIEKMDQDITLFENRAKQVDEEYQSYGEDKAKWPPHIQTQYNQEKQQAREDSLAVISQRNNLVRDYNSASEKFNWAPFLTKPDKPKDHYEEYLLK